MTRPCSLLIIGKVWPEPGSSAAGSRMMQLIQLFKSEGWEITFASAAGKSGFETDLEQLGGKEQKIKLNDSSFDDFIRSVQPSVVLFDRFMTEEQFGWRVAEEHPAALRILDTEDLHCLRDAREQAWKEGRAFHTTDLFSDIAKREIASIYRSDLSLIISETEMEILNECFGIRESLLHYVPFMLQSMEPEMLDKLPVYEQRAHFVSIGNFLHKPNWNAVLYLKEDIWPHIRTRLPEAELHIYGAYSSQKVEQLHNAEQGFLIKGRAEDAKDVISNARLLLAPLRFGAGIKGKLTEAMQCGTPSVTTSIGAESMQGDLEWPGAVEEKPELFAEKAVWLYTHKREWEKAQEKGIQIINRRFAAKEVPGMLLKRIYLLVETLDNHRANNFVGQILLHHTAASTRYMAKWIEEKNA
ncbi:MAG: glycosyltransferase family 4 protein [Balneolaceae bacterium]|nr:glycosyltransferase family 4 protein [Balneolaceae bacterium]